jgi:hypothetical protein
MGQFQRKISGAQMIAAAECGDQLLFALDADRSTSIARLCSESVRAPALWHVDASRLPPGKDDRLLRSRL